MRPRAARRRREAAELAAGCTSSEPDLRRRTDSAAVARDDIECVLARAPVDVRCEPVVTEIPGAAPRADSLARSGVALREPDCRCRRVGGVAPKHLCDPPGAVRVIECELAEHACAEDCDVLPMRTRS